MNLPLHSNINPNPCNPMTESQGVDSHRDRELIEPISVAMQNPLGKKPRYNFVPKKSLEEVVDVLKERVSPAPAIEPTQGLHDKPTVKKNRKKKKQGNSDLSFINKRQARLISRSLRNQQQDHLSSISVIEVDDHLTDDEINDFLAREDVDNQGLGNEIVSEATQYDFVSKLPSFLKDQKGFAGIGHDLKQATGKTEAPIAEYTQPQPAIAPVHYDNCLDWVERYYRDIPYLQAQLKHLAARNSLLEQENHELKACTDQASKRPKRTSSVIIKNATNFNAIINSELSDPSLSNF
jgi:hypothetical protein